MTTQPETHPVPPEHVWQAQTVAVWLRYQRGKWTAFKSNFQGPWHLSDDGGKTSLFEDEYLQSVMEMADKLDALAAARGEV